MALETSCPNCGLFGPPEGHACPDIFHGVSHGFSTFHADCADCDAVAVAYVNARREG